MNCGKWIVNLIINGVTKIKEKKVWVNIKFIETNIINAWMCKRLAIVSQCASWYDKISNFMCFFLISVVVFVVTTNPHYCYYWTITTAYCISYFSTSWNIYIPIFYLYKIKFLHTKLNIFWLYLYNFCVGSCPSTLVSDYQTTVAFFKWRWLPSG